MVKPGYKETEIGVIPEEWGFLSLKKMTTGHFTYGVNAPAVPYAPPLPNYIRITDISDDGYFVKEGRTSVECQNAERYLLRENDIVFARTGASTGKTYLYCKTDGDLVYAGFLIKASIVPEVANSKYIFNILHTKRYWDWVTVTSMRSGQPGINGNEYAEFVIPVPPLPEQERIAEALSDVDNLIISFEKLIAKKRAIKQGAMQELLTGKKRLHGFSGEWEKCSFGDVFDFIPNNAFTRAEMSTNGTVKNIHYGDVLTKYGCWIDANDTDIPYLMEHINLDRFRATCYLQTGDVIIADTAEDETVGKALEIVNVTVPVLAGQHTLLCRSRIKFADKFLGYYLNADCYHSQLLPFIVGTKVSSISKASVAQTSIYLPSIEEQTAIASILSDMDSEIEALEQKLEKTRQVKQGMMQELLTGRIRLV